MSDMMFNEVPKFLRRWHYTTNPWGSGSYARYTRQTYHLQRRKPSAEWIRTDVIASKAGRQKQRYVYHCRGMEWFAITVVDSRSQRFRQMVTTPISLLLPIEYSKLVQEISAAEVQ